MKYLILGNIASPTDVCGVNEIGDCPCVSYCPQKTTGCWLPGSNGNSPTAEPEPED